MSLSFLDAFYLAGGTSLSLRFGHRISDDIDLFCSRDFDNAVLQKQLTVYYAGASLQSIQPVPFGIFAYIHDIKVDLMYWGEDFIREPDVIDGIRLASLEDILAMKLEAITNRKTKKDFYDLALLFERFSLKQGLEYYNQRFPYFDEMAVLKNVTDFEIADAQPDPVLLNCPSWSETKQTVIDKFDRFFAEG